MKTTAQQTKQLSFSQAEYGGKKKLTRRDVFLAQMGSVVPWARLNAVIEPYYPKSGKRGRPPIGLGVFDGLGATETVLGLPVTIASMNNSPKRRAAFSIMVFAVTAQTF